MKITPFFAWYDFWAGMFWDREKRRLYILPVPMLGVYIQFPRRAAAQISREEIEMFERAFSGGIGSCVMDCHCGKTYFDAEENAYDWEEGEYERLSNNPNAFPTIGSVGQVVLEGREYVNACDCWHDRAKAVIGFMNSHGHGIASYLEMERKRAMGVASRMPSVKGGAA